MSNNTIMVNSLYSKVESILREMLNSQQELGWDDNLIEYGLDSLNSIRLVVKLEVEFDIEFDDTELIFENFSTIRKIITNIESKLGNQEN